MNSQLLKVFKLKAQKPQSTQRTLAAETNFSLGKINQSLDELKQRGLLDENSQVSLQGEKYIDTHHPQRAVILAAGYGMRMVPINTEEPKGLLEVQGEPLIERLIKQLRAVNVNNIQIVVGFMKEHYEYLIDKYDVKLLVNSHYSDWNNLYSLYLAKNQLANGYVVPSDVWFKDNPFSNIEDESWYSFSTQTTDQSMWRVNAKDRVVRTKQPGNRMIGVAYLNQEDADRLADRLNQRVDKHEGLSEFWESALIQGNRFALSGKLVSSDRYAEINSYEELRDLDGSSDHLKNDAIDVITKALNVSNDEIHNIRVLKKGMTNRSFIFECQDRHYIMRIPGAGTAKLIDRQGEYDVYQQVKDLPYVEQTLYLNPENGYKLTRFIEHSHNCDANNWEEVSRCMQLLKKMHASHLQVNHEFNLYKQIALYEQLRNGASAYRDYDQVHANIMRLRKFIDRQDKEWTLCHIDANPDNFVFDNQGDLYLIDWEYAGMQDAHVDIAMFAIYAMYDQDQVDRLIGAYFGHAISQQVRYKIYAYIAICGLLWSNWCEYKQSLGLDFGEYSLAQYRYAKEYSRKVLSYLEGEKDATN